MIRQGDIFWLSLEPPLGSEPDNPHPYVVVQNDLFNESRISTVVVCGVTSNLKRAAAPGNVLLEKGEANLSKRSVVNVSQLVTVDRRRLTEQIGTLSPSRVRQIFEGVKLLLEPRGLEIPQGEE